MIIEQALCIIYAAILMAFIRRIDGQDKPLRTDRVLIGFVVRSFPVALFALMCGLMSDMDWRGYAMGATVGGAVSVGLQMQYRKWEELSLYQVFRMWPSMLGFAVTCLQSVSFSLVGVVACFLAGLVRPVLDRRSVANYTVYSEYAEGALMCMPFFVVLF